LKELLPQFAKQEGKDLKMEAADSSETIPPYLTVWCYRAKDCNLNSHCQKNLKYHCMHFTSFLTVLFCHELMPNVVSLDLLILAYFYKFLNTKAEDVIMGWLVRAST
jgi:hypothetical protein